MYARVKQFQNLKFNPMPILILIILLIGGGAYWFINKSVENHKHWQHTFDGLQLSAEEFYKAVQEAIIKREIPDVKFSRVSYSQSGIFGNSREYLHIVKGEYEYDVCAAPYGTGFFVSLWYAERPSVNKKLMAKVPALKQMADTKSYYQIDTDGMANSAIRGAFTAAIDTVTSSKGVRGLSETERVINL
jgi:hypothetical protein